MSTTTFDTGSLYYLPTPTGIETFIDFVLSTPVAAGQQVDIDISISVPLDTDFTAVFVDSGTSSQTFSAGETTKKIKVTVNTPASYLGATSPTLNSSIGGGTTDPAYTTQTDMYTLPSREVGNIDTTSLPPTVIYTPGVVGSTEVIAIATNGDEYLVAVEGVTNLKDVYQNTSDPGQTGDKGYMPRIVTTRNTSLGFVFQNETGFNQPIGNWDTSNVTDMVAMFEGASIFNQPIGDWNVGNVTNATRMFNAATAFNQPLANWERISPDVSTLGNVTNMGAMFTGSSFDQPIGNWDTSSVTIMQSMFSFTSFDQPIGDWNVSNVTTMEAMFEANTSFNQPLANWERSTPGDESTVGNVTTMSEMFQGASSFNQPIGNWNVSSVLSTGAMFNAATAFNQPLANWERITPGDESTVGNVTFMGSMFKSASVFDQDISNWDVSSVKIMGSMFRSAISFNQDISTWDVLTNIPTKPNGFDDGTLTTWLDSEKPWYFTENSELSNNFSYSIESCFTYKGNKFNFINSYPASNNILTIQGNILEALAEFIRSKYDKNYEVPTGTVPFLFFDNVGETTPSLDGLATFMATSNVTSDNIKTIITTSLYSQIVKFVKSFYKSNSSNNFNYKTCDKSFCLRSSEEDSCA